MKPQPPGEFDWRRRQALCLARQLLENVTDALVIFDLLRELVVAFLHVDPLTLSQRSEIAAIVSRLRLPAIYGYREFVERGGLMSYGTDHAAQWRRGAEIVDLILKGAKPADIPVEQPTKFELVVNLRQPRPRTSRCRQRS